MKFVEVCLGRLAGLLAALPNERLLPPKARPVPLEALKERSLELIKRCDHAVLGMTVGRRILDTEIQEPALGVVEQKYANESYLV